MDNDWDREYIEAENAKVRGDNQLYPGGKEVPMMFSYAIDISGNSLCDGPWDRKFKNQEILDNFRKYVDCF